MGVFCRISIGGDIDHRLMRELATAIDGSGASVAYFSDAKTSVARLYWWGFDDDLTDHLSAPRRHLTAGGETLFGEFGALESWLSAHDVPYDRYTAADGNEYDAERVSYRPGEGYFQRPANCEGEDVFQREELEAILNLLKMRLFDDATSMLENLVKNPSLLPPLRFI